MDKIAIVILNWNGKKLLEKFLPSVVEHSPLYSNIYIADNASTDDSVSFVKSKYPQIGIIELKKNWGFAAGYNKALEQIKAEYYVLLNSDVEVTEKWVEPIVELMDQNPDIGACQPKIRAYNQRDEFEYAGAAGGFIDKWGYPLCRGRIFNVFEKDHGQYDDVREIFWASGAAMFVRSSVYKKAEGLDEDFFAHMEEIDLCWRMKNMGYRVYFHYQSLVFHVGGGTLTMGTPHKTYLNFRNNLQLLTKNLPKRKFLPLILLRLILDGIAAVSFLPNPSGWGNFWAVFKAHINFYINLPRTLKKRKKIPKRPVSCIYRKSVVSMFFIHKIKSFSGLGDFYT